MRPYGAPQSKKYQEKAAVRKIVWIIILIFVLYSAYAVAKPLAIMLLFRRETAQICNEQTLRDRNLDFGPLVSEIQTKATGWANQGLTLQKNGVTCRSQGGINHVTVAYATQGSWLGIPMTYEWEEKYMSQQKRTGY